MEKEIEKQLSDFMTKEGYIKKSDVAPHEHTHEEPKHNHEEPKHNHATRSFDKFCPDCEQPNPDFKEPEWFCNNDECLKPIGSEKDMKDAKVCYNCGGSGAIHKDSEDFKNASKGVGI